MYLMTCKGSEQDDGFVELVTQARHYNVMSHDEDSYEIGYVFDDL